MDIGKDVGRVKGNRQFNDARTDINILRKPHFNSSQFITKYDSSGWYVSLVNDKNRTKMPFEIEECKNLTDGDDTEKLFFTVKNGSWERIIGMDGSKNELYIDETASTQFEKITNHDIYLDTYDMLTEDDYYWKIKTAYALDAVKSDTVDKELQTRWIYLLLINDSNFPNHKDYEDDAGLDIRALDTEPYRDGLNPIKLVLKISDANKKSDILALEKIRNGNVQYCIKFIGSVVNYQGGLIIRQTWLGDIKDQYIVPDTLGNNQTWKNTSKSYLAGLSYFSVSNSASNGVLQDLNARESLLDSDSIVEFQDDRAIVYYDFVKKDTEIKQIEKKYARVDSNKVTNSQHNSNGASLQITDNGVMQIYDFASPSKTDDITEIVHFNQLDGNDYYPIARQSNVASVTYPKVQYLNAANVHGYTHGVFVAKYNYFNDGGDKKYITNGGVTTSWGFGTTLINDGKREDGGDGLIVFDDAAHTFGFVESGVYRVNYQIWVQQEDGHTDHEGYILVTANTTHANVLSRNYTTVFKKHFETCGDDDSSSESLDSCDDVETKNFMIQGDFLVRWDSKLASYVNGYDCDDGVDATYGNVNFQIELYTSESSVYQICEAVLNIERVKGIWHGDSD